MIGTYRTILAVMVVFQHLGGMASTGSFAVFTFFVISGYLMTFILAENYGFTIKGRTKFVVNRFLRIYPPYWGALLLSIAIVIFIDREIVIVIGRQMKWFENTESFFRNIFLFFNHTTKNRLVPPAWALPVEFFYYLLMALGISRTKKRTFAWFSVGLLYTILVNIFGLSWEYFYFYFAAGSLPFSIGALLYHFKDEIFTKAKWLKYKYSPLFLLILVWINYFISIELRTRHSVGFYLNLLISTVLIASLLTQDRLVIISKKLDQRIGDFSYPIYLLHKQAGVITYIITGLKSGNLLFASLTMIIVLLFSWILLKLVSYPIENLRHRVKQVEN